MLKRKEERGGGANQVYVYTAVELSGGEKPSEIGWRRCDSLLYRALVFFFLATVEIHAAGGGANEMN